MHCPADGGILVLTAYVVRNGTGFVFALQDPDGGPAAEPATKTAFEGFLANVSFGD